MIPRRAWSYVRQFQHLRQHRVRIVPVSYLRSLPPASMLSLDPDEDDPPSTLRSSHFPGSGEQAVITALDCQDLVSTLRADWKRFLLLRFWEDKSSRRIAAQTSCSSRTVERGVSAALAQLRRHLDEDKAAV
jgi:DNA-directed RNA polymerase specialized sigma24 family protein